MPDIRTPCLPGTPVSRLFALSILLLLGACSLTDGEGVEARYVETLFVDAETAECVGEGVYQCLRVKRDPEAEWELFYDAIEGFTYEPSFRYVLEVEVRAVTSPPADGSSRAYRLVRVVEKTPG